ncbi:MAG: OsmC family protein [Thermoplasmatota archaeon]
MSELRLVVRHTGDGNVVECRAPSGARLAFDGEEGLAGATPMEHLLASLGACALMDVAVILRKKRFAFTDLHVECAGLRVDEGHPRPFESLSLEFHVAGDVPARVLEDAAKLTLAKYCNVAATLARSPPIRIEATAPVREENERPPRSRM